MIMIKIKEIETNSWKNINPNPISFLFGSLKFILSAQLLHGQLHPYTHEIVKTCWCLVNCAYSCCLEDEREASRKQHIEQLNSLYFDFVSSFLVSNKRHSCWTLGVKLNIKDICNQNVTFNISLTIFWIFIPFIYLFFIVDIHMNTLTIDDFFWFVRSLVIIPFHRSTFYRNKGAM